MNFDTHCLTYKLSMPLEVIDKESIDFIINDLEEYIIKNKCNKFILNINSIYMPLDDYSNTRLFISILEKYGKILFLTADDIYSVDRFKETFKQNIEIIMPLYKFLNPEISTGLYELKSLLYDTME